MSWYYYMLYEFASKITLSLWLDDLGIFNLMTRLYVVKCFVSASYHIINKEIQIIEVQGTFVVNRHEGVKL